MTTLRDGELLRAIVARWGDGVGVERSASSDALVIDARRSVLPGVAHWLASDRQMRFATALAVSEHDRLKVHYAFCGIEAPGWVELVSTPDAGAPHASLRSVLPAAYWEERRISEETGTRFEGHSDREALPASAEPGSFTMPVGPVYSGSAESALFLLETWGENVVRAVPRLFYKQRRLERLAEGRPVRDALLLAERCNGRSAFAHAWGFARAAERIFEIDVPERARMLRTYLAELERYRAHVAVIREICESTGLAVATSRAAILEEELLRLSGELCGHRYLFGLIDVGGLTRDFDDARLIATVERLQEIHGGLRSLGAALRFEGSFFDRLENIGVISPEDVREYDLVGPVARASGSGEDLRLLRPYGGYRRLALRAASEDQGDGAARMRVLFRECASSLRLVRQVVPGLRAGPVCVPIVPRTGSALASIEAPRGAAFHWLECDERGAVVRYRLAAPSFRNWLGFHLGMERFSFQDFPITLATLGLSVAESDC